MDNNNTNNNKPNNKVNMPKFNLNWLYMIIALMLLGLWWSSDSRGSGSKRYSPAIGRHRFIPEKKLIKIPDVVIIGIPYAI